MNTGLEDIPIQLQNTLMETLRVHQLELETQNEELRRTHAELDISRARYFDLYEMAPVGYFTIHTDETISEANFTAAHLLGMQPSALVGSPIQSIIFPADQDIYYHHAKELTSTGTPQTCELRMATLGKSPFWAQLMASLDTDAAGNTIHRLIVTNINERKLAQDTLRRNENIQKILTEKLQLKNVEFQAATRLAEKSNLAKSEFLSSMSHELRSPLNAIVGFAQLLESGTPAPTPLQQNNIQRILTGGWYLLKIINEILDLSLIESGKLSFNLQSTPLAPILWQCRDLMNEKALKNNIDLQIPGIDPALNIIADPVRLTQVMINLLSNGIKYNRPDGKVVVDVQTKSENTLRITVKDTGNGLTPNELQHLFESFNRLGQERGQTEGTGIGLTVSKRLTEMMGGAIGVESIPSEGSEFWVEFKLALAPLTQADPWRTEIVGHALPSPSQSSVLYIEDSLANVDLVAQILKQRTNFHFYSAGDGLQGLEMARRHLPLLVLLDINLPGLNGREILALIKQDPVTRHIPVIAISANAMPLDVASGLSAGFFRYLTKPFVVDDLMEAIRLAMEQARRSQSKSPS